MIHQLLSNDIKAWREIPERDRFYFKQGYCYRVNRAEAAYLLKRMRSLLRNSDVYFIIARELHPWNGYNFNYAGDWFIALSPYDDLLPTAVHELLHLLHYGAMESEVRAMERQLVLLMSNAQHRNLLISITDHFWRGRLPFKFSDILERNETKDTIRSMRQRRKANEKFMRSK